MKAFYASIIFLVWFSGIATAQCTLAVPGGFKSGIITNCSIDLTWKAVSGASNYKVQFRVTGSSTWNVLPLAGSSPVTVGDLISNTPYDFEVASCCADGSVSTFSNVLSRTTKKCSTPVGTGTTNISSSGATANWTQPCNAGQFSFQYKKASDTKWTTINGVTSTSYSLTNLTTSTSYNWRVKAVCGSDKSSYSTIANFTTQSNNITRKNLLFILLDDARYDVTIPTGGPSWFQTPNINRIASEGVNFQVTIPATSQCSPSRASYYTGLYPHLDGVANNGDKLSNSFPLVQQILTDHGYYTGFVGKYGQYLGQPKGFDWWATSDGDIYVDPNYKINGKDTLIPGNIIDVYPQLAKRFLNSVPAGKSFALFYFTRAPHDPVVPRVQDTSLYANDVMPFPSDFKFYTANYPSYYNNFRWNAADTATVTDEIRRTLQAIKGTDDNVDSIFTWLDEKHWMDSTLIIFSSDNGMIMGEHKMNGKVLALEESIRVPLFVRYPQWFSPNTIVSDEIASNIDVTATILDYYDIPNTYGFQGISLRKLASGELPRKNFLYEYAGDQMNSPIRAVRTLTGIYIKSYCDQVTEEYYDLVADPHEDSNLIFNPVYAATIAKCQLLLDSLQNVYNDLGTITNQNCQLTAGTQRFSAEVCGDPFSSDFVVSPSLAGKSFNVKFENAKQQSAVIRIFNFLNVEVFEQALPNSSFEKQIDCINWPNGVYLVEVEQEGSSLSKKLVVSK